MYGLGWLFFRRCWIKVKVCNSGMKIDLFGGFHVLIMGANQCEFCERVCL